MKDPSTGVHGAGFAEEIHAYREAKKGVAGVVEARPGIIETANIDPLHKGMHIFILHRFVPG